VIRHGAVVDSQGRPGVVVNAATGAGAGGEETASAIHAVIRQGAVAYGQHAGVVNAATVGAAAVAAGAGAAVIIRQGAVVHRCGCPCVIVNPTTTRTAAVGAVAPSASPAGVMRQDAIVHREC